MLRMEHEVVHRAGQAPVAIPTEPRLGERSKFLVDHSSTHTLSLKLASEPEVEREQQRRERSPPPIEMIGEAMAVPPPKESTGKIAAPHEELIEMQGDVAEVR